MLTVSSPIGVRPPHANMAALLLGDQWQEHSDMLVATGSVQIDHNQDMGQNVRSYFIHKRVLCFNDWATIKTPKTFQRVTCNYLEYREPLLVVCRCNDQVWLR